MIRILIVLLVSALLASPAFAQETPQDYWRDAMARLSFIEGEFTVVGEAMTQEGWQAGAPTIMTSTLTLDGAGLVEHGDFNTPAFSSTLTTTYSYDGFREVYRLSVLDNAYGLMDIYEGNFEGEAFVATNLRSGTSFPLADGRQMFFRITVMPSDSGHVSVFDYSVDEGANWASIYRITYIRA